jgi:hypothetical protein
MIQMACVIGHTAGHINHINHILKASAKDLAAGLCIAQLLRRCSSREAGDEGFLVR